MTLPDQDWFTEICPESGSAFSLKLKEKLHEEKTKFQKISIYETEHFGTLMAIDDLVMLTDRDNFVYHEMMTHPVLFTHPAPRRVLIIGGGDCGTLHEVMKHPEVERADMVEIDERVTRLAEQYFPELCASNGDPRAHIRFEDGIRWVHEAPAESIDVIIIDSTDPYGPAEGLFREPFYRDCVRALRPQGLLVQQSESPLIHMRILRDMHKTLRAAGFSEVRTMQFPQPSYPTGWWSATMAAKGGDLGTFREADVEARSFDTRYYNAGIHRAALAMPEFFKKELG